jgi:glycosyltransferase involved in cell wall biosynthesis
MPRVTVLLTCYNHLPYLREAWNSLLSQTYSDWEVIALDDGSTDGTREWLRSLSDPRLRVVLNEVNLGTYETLNVGLRLAAGEFVAVFNDDDLWAPTKLSRQVDMMDSHPAVGLVHTDGWFIDGEGRERRDSPLGFEFPRTETGDQRLALIYANKIIASAVLTRRECFSQLGEFNRAYFGSGDWEMWLRIADRWHIGFVPEPLTMYRVHGANASHKLERIWLDDQRLREWIADRWDSYVTAGSEAEVRRAEAHNWACLGTVRKLNGDPRAARAAYLRSLRLEPTRWKSALRYLATFAPRTLFWRLR